MNNFTNILKIIEGCLLGDGHLELQKNAKNASFKYQTSSKQHAEFVHQFFREYCTDTYKTIKRGEYFDIRTNKTYISYYFKTKALPIFTEQQKRFYHNKIKLIPKNLILNSIVLLFWYIGDGELESKNGIIKLHTNSFSFDDVNFLVSNLRNYNASISKKTINQFIITIPRKSVKSFLINIGKCPFDDYKHKWKFVDYKNKNIEENGMNDYSNILPEIAKDFINTKINIYKLHKKYKVPIKSIKHYFNMNKIDWIPINNKKIIIQSDLNGFIMEWNSCSEINEVLGYDCSAISKCCKGLRKTHRNFFWNFKN